MMNHVVRRGLEHASTRDFIKRAIQEGPHVEMPGWGIFILVTSFLVILVFMSLVDYSLKDVVATLAMVETPSAAITVSAARSEEGSKDDKESLLETGPTITLVHQMPITSSIRGTLRHLVSLAGGWARVRGIRSLYIYNLFFSITTGVISSLFPKFPGSLVIVAAASGAATANFHAAWTHKVISMPTTLSMFQRIPARSEWKVLAPAAAVAAAMPYVSLYIMSGFAVLLGLDRINPERVQLYSGADFCWLLSRFAIMFVLALSCTLFICLPAMVTQIRVEASILPEEQDTIVPFDRTFNGKVVAKILGGTGSIGFMDAWRSFNWEARIRLIKVYVKAFFIITGMLVALGFIMFFEAWAIAGSALSKAVQQYQAQGN